MARNIRLHAQSFMRSVLGALSTSVPTDLEEVLSVVSHEPEEDESVKRVLGVAVKQKYVTQQGEGDTATFLLTADGENLLTEITGR